MVAELAGEGMARFFGQPDIVFGIFGVQVRIGCRDLKSFGQGNTDFGFHPFGFGFCNVGGLEDVLTNDLALSAGWEIRSSWRWAEKSYIKVLEAAACLKLLRDLAKRGGDQRVVVFLDSHVAFRVL